MALANGADILAREGFRVLMIDFDLEAPGLEHYFPVDHKLVRAHVGLFDLILHYKAAMASSLPTEQQAQDFRRLRDLFIVPIYPRLPSGGKLDLMPAGCRGSDEQLSEYALGLRQFDWQDFYFNFGGEVFFEWLRRSLDLKLYDVVLVDSRTGVTEMGGICAYQLADIIIVMCASNQQNLDGTRDVVNNFFSHRVQTLRAGRELKLLVVPSRVETRDATLLTDFRERFEHMFAERLPKELSDAGMTYWDLMIPYEPRSAFQEKVIVPGAQAGDGSTIHLSMQKIVRAIGLLASSAEPVHRLSIGGRPDQQVTVEPQYDITSRFAGFDVFLASASADTEAVGLIARFLGKNGLGVFLHDPKKPSAGEDLMRLDRRALDQSGLCVIMVGPSGEYPWRNEYLRGLLEDKDRATELRFLPILLPGALLPTSDEMPVFLAGLSWLRLTQLDDHPELSRIVEAITSTSAVTPARAERVSRGTPYKGLVPYEEADASIFFGREELVDRIIKKLADSRFVMLIGPSASGKTSLVRAGVIPALRHGVIPGSDCWRYVFMRLGTNPVREFFDGLAAVTPDAASISPNETLNSQTLESFLSGSSQDRYLVVVDQIEELFTVFLDRSVERSEFIDLLLNIASDRKSRIALILVMRSDYLSRVLEISPGWWKSVENRIEFVGPMSAEALHKAIEAPAQSMGFAIEPGLVELIMKDTAGEPGALSLVQYLLYGLWERRRSGYLTVEAYRELGGVTGLVAREAERFFNELEPTDQEKVKAVLLRLVAFSPERLLIRRLATLDDLVSSGSRDDIRRILDRLAAARLVVVSSERGSTRIEVVHESLFRAWPRLTGWLEEDTAFLVWQQRLNATIGEWEQSQRSSDLLLRGLPLHEALEWLKRKPDYFSPDVRQFVAASQNRKTKERRTIAIVAGLVLWLIGGTTWLWQKGYSVDQAMLKVQSLFVSIHVVPAMAPPIPAGTFQQGDVEKLGEPFRNPVRSVTIKPFAMGKYEVTFEEYDRFAIATGRRLPEDLGWGRGQRPVMNVSWEDAHAYAAWLSKVAGNGYRLPTESEWEYAARSGAKQEIWAGTSEESQLGEYAVFYKNSRNQTSVVGEKHPNGFGLHDMSGNVFEWVEDCLHNTYERAPTNGSAWLDAEGGDCGRRVIRGGSWVSLSGYLRLSYRDMYPPNRNGSDLGFRLAQDIP